MIDISQAMALVSSLKTAGEITTAIVGLRDTTLIQSKVIELNGVILAAQNSALAANVSQGALLDQVRSLEQEITRLKKWDGDKQQYKLTKIGTGAFAYTPKPNTEVAEPPHWLCVKCYDNSERSFLQFQGRTPNRNESIYKCVTCKTEFKVEWQHTPESVAAALGNLPTKT